MANENSSMGETFRELRELLVGYARQETVDPLNKLKRYLGLGIPGALLLALGLFFISMGILRWVQHWDKTAAGFWSMAPYGASFAFLLLVIGINGMKASRSMKRGDDGMKGVPR